MIRAQSCNVSNRSWNVAACALLASGLAASAFGQASAVRAGSFEVGPFVGASYIDQFRVMGGGNVTYAFKNKYVLPYFEYSYFPGIPKLGTVPGLGPNSSYNVSLPLSDIHGGVHIRLPIFKESPIVPYLAIGFGVLHFGSTTGTATYPGPVNPATGMSAIETQQVTVQGENDATFNAGGGLRYYLGGSGRFGFRAEAKIYKPFTGSFSNNTIGKVEAGFFFQLH